MMILQRLLLCRISGEIWGILPVAILVRNGLFVPLTEAGSLLSVPDGVLLGVMPPAGDFLCEQKVTKNSLKTYGFKNSLVLTCTVSPPWLF